MTPIDWRSVTLRQAAGCVLLAMLFAGAFEPMFLKIFVTDRDALRYELTLYPDVAFPTFPPFLEQVRSTTEPSSAIALVVPMRTWHGGYEHAFLRASYILAGRRVVPFVTPDNRLQLDRVGAADYVAAWRTNYTNPEFAPVWKSSEGTLERRSR